MERNRNKAGVTISDGCDGILYIGADSKNTVTTDATVTGEEKGWLDGGEFGICAGWDMGCGRGGQPSRQRGIFGAVRQIFHQQDAEV